MLVSWDVPPPRTKDRDALELLASIMTEGQSSRLNKRMVDQDKVALQAQMITGFPIPTYGPGQLMTLVIPANGVEAAKAREVLWEEIQLVQSKGVSKKELDKARAKRKFEYVNSLGNTLFKAMELATYETFFGGADKFIGDYKRYDAITVKDIQRVAQEYLTVDKSVTFDIKPGAGGMGGMMGGMN